WLLSRSIKDEPLESKILRISVFPCCCWRSQHRSLGTNFTEACFSAVSASTAATLEGKQKSANRATSGLANPCVVLDTRLDFSDLKSCSSMFLSDRSTATECTPSLNMLFGPFGVRIVKEKTYSRW